MRVLLFFAIVVVVPAALLALAIEGGSAARAPGPTTHEDVERFRDLLRRHDPRRLAPGETRTVVVTERELNVALHHALTRAPRFSASAILENGAAEVALSVRLPKTPLGRFINLTGRLASPDGGGILVERVALGRIPFPAWLADRSVGLTHRLLRRVVEKYRRATAAVRGLELRSGAVAVTLVWDPALSDGLKTSGRSLLLSGDERKGLETWASRIDDTIGSLGRSASLAPVLSRLFSAARVTGGDPAAENRALLLSFGLQAAGKPVAKIARANGIPAPRARTRLTLRGRHDLGRHFLVSAAATAAADAGLAFAAGLFKEIDDSRGGSGFSFADLAADRAGIRLAKLAAHPASAVAVQKFFSKGITEDDFMPEITGLEEGLQEADFQRRFGGPEDPRYKRVIAEIDRRIDSRELFLDPLPADAG